MRDLKGPVTPPEPLARDRTTEGEAAWVVTTQASVHAAPGGRKVRALPNLSIVTVLERADRGKASWLRVGEAEWIRAKDTTSPRPTSPPAELFPDERWLDVDIERQVLTGYVGERALFSMPVSTGRGKGGTELATPRGVHRLWVKLRTSDMDNLENLEARESYAIQSVPWVMYFDRGYGLHGAFWHRAFGRVQSHGCVNLTPADAERVFQWTSPRLPEGWSAVLPTDYERGTLVSVR
jgi:lipoprotein-anchoring transpeptidase ErfK/SrfK